ncbi:sugar transferase [Microbacterium sp. SD291]|nr:sugar transferase [Microbacterium sp. SD291]
MRLIVTDAAIITFTLFGAQLLRFGLQPEQLELTPQALADLNITYTMVSIAIALTWMVSLSVSATREHHVVGSGATEYKRVVDGSLRAFGFLAIIAFVFQLQLARGYLLIALPIGVGLLVLGRLVWRRWLRAQRRRGLYTQRALLVGEREKSEHVAREILGEQHHGIAVVGAVTEHGGASELMPGVPVLGEFSDLLRTVDACGADMVVISGSDTIGPGRLRELGWELESRRIDLIVAPSLTDIAGPRIHARPVAGLSLIHVDYPTFSGWRYASKRAFDVLGAAFAILLLSPLLLVLSAAVRRDGAPAMFVQYRVGLNGKPFRMLKFRSMVPDAEDRLPSLIDQSDGNGVLFKMKDDPRVTRIGRTLRRFSLDELPQLFNVLRGEMSLVGPRPPLAKEVSQYGDWGQRRFLVKPGLTGLWQVSGRSNLSWEDSVRLDLNYVENWSFTGDAIILWRTVRAVMIADGAY